MMERSLHSRLLNTCIIVGLLCCAVRVTAQKARWEALKARVEQLYQQGDYAGATPLAIEALKVSTATFGPRHLNTAIALNNLGLLYETQSQYSLAEPLLQSALTIREDALGANDPLVARSLGVLAQLYGSENKNAAAVPLFQRAIAIDENALGPESTDVATLCGNLAEIYQSQDAYSEAEPLFKRALTIDEKALGPNSPDLAADLNNLAELYESEGKYAAELAPLERALAINEKAYGPEHPVVAKALNNLAEAYEDLGRYRDAEPLLKRSLAIRKKDAGPKDPEVALGLTNLAELDEHEGIYAAAEPLLEQALAIDEEALGLDDPTVAVDLNNLADLYQTQGKYAAAEPLFQRSLAIREKVQGQDHPDVAVALGNLGSLYTNEGRYDQARPLLLRAIEIDRKRHDPYAPQLALDLNNLATLAEAQGAYGDAQQALQLVLELDEKTLGPDHPKVAIVLGNLAAVYFDEDKLKEAEQAIQRSLKIDEATLGPAHPDLAQGLNLLASIYDSENRLTDATPLYERAIHLQEAALGPDHPALVDTLANLAVNLEARGNFEEAELQFRRAFNNVSRQFDYSFSYMTEKERLDFLHTVENDFPVFFSFVYRFHDKDPRLAASMYDLLLWEKGAVARSVASLRREVENSGDKQALDLLNTLSAERSQLAALSSMRPPDRVLWRQQVDLLQTHCNALEKELVTRSAVFTARKKLEQATWRDVRDVLKPDEAAVEITRFQYFENAWKKTSYYVALVVTRETKDQPEFVLLGDAQEIEADALTQFRRSTQTRGLSSEDAAVPGARAYELIWKPLEAALARKTRIYIAADGALNEIPLGIIPAPDGKLQMERYDLRFESSTSDLLRTNPIPGPKTALLLGDPAFDASFSPHLAAAQRHGIAPSNTISHNAPPTTRGSPHANPSAVTLPRLPATATEVSTIAKLLRRDGWESNIFTASSASKMTVEGALRPRLIHLATHGFFLPDPGAKSGPRDVGDKPSPMSDPMLRSGLYFAGANHTLAGESTAPDQDNGVLTAMEAGSLNLNGTELIVLSACNTGQGDVRNGEGVFGLRRALQEAGAQSVLMSLWSVPDKETLELMQHFYAKWLGGMEKHQALKQAQLEIREEVKLAHGGQDFPFYWGAFVLVGD